MLAVTGRRQFDLRTGQKRMESLPVQWVDIADPDPSDSAIASQSVYQQGSAQGGTTFARLEGCWYGGDSVFFTATTGGDSKLGQVWQYIPQDNDKGTLKLIFTSSQASIPTAH